MSWWDAIKIVALSVAISAALTAALAYIALR